MGDLVKWGGRHVVTYGLVRDFKRIFNKPLYDELVENAFYYAPPYLQVCSFMAGRKRWPILILPVYEWMKPQSREAFRIMWLFTIRLQKRKNWSQK
ncbi:MAG: hypothetical protein NVSMB24_19580 [Mucilaginibacter sp.]